MTRMRASQLIGASGVVKNVNQGLQNATETERQARPLTKLPASDQPAAWERAQVIAETGGEAVKAKHVEQAVGEMKDLEPKDGVVC